MDKQLWFIINQLFYFLLVKQFEKKKKIQHIYGCFTPAVML